MFGKICDIIEQRFGIEQITVLKKELTDDDAVSLLYNAISAENANQLIECLLQSNDEDLYWYIWDNVIYSIGHLTDPLPFTQEMKKRYLLGKKEKFNSPFHITSPVSTKRLTLSALDENTVCLLKDEIEKEGELQTFIDSLDAYSDKFRMYFSIVRNDTNEPVGYVGLTFLKRWGAATSDNTCNLEYYIIPKHRRNGFLTEAAKKVIELAFEGKIETMNDNHHDYIMEKSNANIEMIKIMCNVNNKASHRCALSLGFKEEGAISFVEEKKIYYEYMFSKSKFDT